MTIILITHSPELAKETERIITISDGSVVSDTGTKVQDAGGENNDAV